VLLAQPGARAQGLNSAATTAFLAPLRASAKTNNGPMLKKIPVSELRLGMHLHRFEAAWIDHPFWRSRFTLSDTADLAAIAASCVRECWIDVSQGADVSTSAGPAVAPQRGAISPRAKPAVASRIAQEPTDLGSELDRAAALCRRSKDAVASMFNEARLGKAIDAEHCRPLVNDIAESVYRNPGALVSLARLKTADDYSYMHSVAVCALMVSLGRTLGLSEVQCKEAGLAGLLHDMGKALMPSEILNKPGKLSDDEFAVMRSHPERGHAMLVEGGGAGDAVLDVCLHHHEKADGSGYPHKLAGDAITLFARMGAVCDVYDAITSDRPYKAGWDPAESIARMASWQGHFDAAVFSAFVKSLGIYPTGSLVRLASGRLAVVLEQNAQALTTPVVKVFFSTQTNLPIEARRLDLAKSNDRITGRESRTDWNFPHLESLWSGQHAR
jgi:HD-GYP domain-containing protein (c-di-GMP phosphodiesterase class II)